MKKISPILILVLFCFKANAQFAKYDFENNLNDNVGNYHGSYEVEGEPSSNTPNYRDGATGKAVHLGPTDAVALPIELNSQIRTEESFQIKFSFKMTSLTGDKGEMTLIGNQSDHTNESGISVRLHRDGLFYALYFTYSDGLLSSVPNHPGHTSEYLISVAEGDLVNVDLKMNFATNSWTAWSNYRYSSGYFKDAYDMDIIKTSLREKPFFLSWQQKHFEHYGSEGSSAFIDDLELYSPEQPTSANELRTALVEMTKKVNDEITLSDDLTNAYTSKILANYNGNYDEVKNEIHAYIQAYEDKYPSVLHERKTQEFNDYDPEARVLIFLQQSIFDQELTLEKLNEFDGFKFEAAESFPGEVAADAPRVTNATVSINGSYSIDPGGRLDKDYLATRRPTGYYAAPGEMVTITIPANLTDKGLSVLIGAHTADHSNLKITNRYLRISKEYPLNNVTTRVLNPFGGGVYIRTPEGLDLGWFDVSISGAVKSPYFSYRTGKKTAIAEWNAEIAKKHVPWVDIESDRFMTTLPLKHFSNFNYDVSLMMERWDDIMKAYNYLGGRPEKSTRAQYYLVDSRLPSNGFGTGYPQVVGDPKVPQNVSQAKIYPTDVLREGFHSDTGLETAFHELGHLFGHPTLPLETESIIHINATYIYNQLYGQTMDESFKFSSGQHLTLDQAAIDWLITFNFRNNNPMSCDPEMLNPSECHEVRYQHRGHAKFIHMADMFGWESVSRMNKYFYDKWKLNPVDSQYVSSDEVIKYASNATGVNMAPLMHFWGLIPSEALQEELASMPQSDLILQKLQYYKDFVPKTKEEFQPYYDSNSENVGSVHLNRYDRTLANYDSSSIGQGIVDQIQYLIDTYFPRRSQTITPVAVTDKVFGDPDFDVSATASSGLDVVFSVKEGPISLSGNTVTITGAGSATIAVNQAGNAQYSAAPEVLISFSIAKATQELSIETISDKTTADAPFDVIATVDSELALSYRIASGPATISGSTISLNGETGTVTVMVEQAGNENYNAASAQVTFNVGDVPKTSQTITPVAVADKVFGDPDFNVSATASSGLNVVFSVQEGPIRVSGNTVTITGTGSATIAVNQAGNAQYSAAPEVLISFFIEKATQEISIETISDKTTADTPFDVRATVDSNLALSYRIASGPATISGSTISLNGETGTVTVMVEQAGNENYNAASAQVTFNVGDVPKTSQTITPVAVADKVFGDPDFNVSATASSGLDVVFSVKEGPIRVSGNTVTITGTGSATIAVNQAGNAQYSAAPEVLISFFIEKATQEISIETISDKTTADTPFDVRATVDSNLALSYRIASGPATISGSRISLNGETGTVTVMVEQAGNANYNAATAQVTFNVGDIPKRSQTIAPVAVADKVFGDPDFDVSATASSGLEVVFSVKEGPIRVSGNTVTITGTGSATIAVNQAGNAQYSAAPEVLISFFIEKATQEISIETISDKTTADTPFDVRATVDSELALSYRIASGPATISGSRISLNGETGTVTVMVEQSGDENHHPAEKQVLFEVVLNNTGSGELIKVYPNPTADMIFVNTTEPVYLQLYNLQGQKLMDHHVESDSIDISELTVGVYLLEVTTRSNQTYYKQIIKN